MIKLNSILNEIKISRPYRITQKGKQLIIDMLELNRMCETYHELNKGTLNGSNWSTLYSAFKNSDEIAERVYLQIGFDLGNTTTINDSVKPITPDMFAQRCKQEFDDEESHSLAIFNNLIKKGYIE